MAEYEIKNPIDFRRGGDTVHDLTDKYISETTRIYRFLNDLKSNSINAVEYTEPSAGQIKVADNTIYIRNADNTEWVELGKVANNFGFLEQVGSKFIGTGDISKEKIAELNSVDLTKALTTDNLGSEAGKIPTLNDAGKLPVNITGDAAKIGGVNINIEAPSDGQSLMYRASTNTWVNENKMAVGGIIPWEARKQYYINDVCLVDTNIYICIYEHESGDEFEQSREIPSEVIGGGTVTVALWKSIGINLDRGVIAEIADEQVAVHNSAVDAHADIRDAVDDKADKTELSKYLPLSGGALTGAITKNSDNDTLFFGGATDYDKGAWLRLSGKDNVYGGAFTLCAHNNKALTGYPDGILLWDNNRLGVVKKEVNIGNLTLNDGGYLSLSDFIPVVENREFVFAFVSYFGGISSADAFSVQGVYLVGAANATITNVTLRCFYI